MAKKRTPAPQAASLSDEQFRDQVLAGGASRHAYTMKEVRVGTDDGYMVGGKPTAKGTPFPARRIPADSFSPADVANHLAEIHTAFPNDPTVHQGGWREGDEAVLDAADRVSSRSQALSLGYARPNDRSDHQDAIFDVKHGVDINLKRPRR
jgi:hypothetical protein